MQDTKTIHEKVITSDFEDLCAEMPVFIFKLKDLVGVQEASKSIGVSRAQYNQMLAGKVPCRRAFELAAELIYTRLAGVPNTAQAAVITVYPTHIGTIKTLLESLGGSFQLLKSKGE